MTRQEYMAAKEDPTAAHQQYYGQYVDHEIKQQVIWTIGLEKIMADTSGHFKNVSLERGRYFPTPHPVWDDVFPKCPFRVAQKMRENGDSPTKATLVCIAKEAARQIKLEHSTTTTT